MKPINALCVQNAALLNLKADCTYSYSCVVTDSVSYLQTKYFENFKH
jgi:hypothetical protein